MKRDFKISNLLLNRFDVIDWFKLRRLWDSAWNLWSRNYRSRCVFKWLFSWLICWVWETWVTSLFRNSITFFLYFCYLRISSSKSYDSLLNVFISFIHSDSCPYTLCFIVVKHLSSFRVWQLNLSYKVIHGNLWFLSFYRQLSLGQISHLLWNFAFIFCHCMRSLNNRYQFSANNFLILTPWLKNI